MYETSSPVFTNCIFKENTGNLGGALAVNNSTPVVINSLVFGNKVRRGGAFYNETNSV